MLPITMSLEIIDLSDRSCCILIIYHFLSLTHAGVHRHRLSEIRNRRWACRIDSSVRSERTDCERENFTGSGSHCGQFIDRSASYHHCGGCSMMENVMLNLDPRWRFLNLVLTCKVPLLCFSYPHSCFVFTLSVCVNQALKYISLWLRTSWVDNAKTKQKGRELLLFFPTEWFQTLWKAKWGRFPKNNLIL